MAEIRVSVEVAQPVAAVFAYLSEMEHLREWAEGVVEVRNFAPDMPGAGTVYVIAGQMLGRRIETTYTIIQYEPGKQFTGQSRIGPVALLDRFTFTPTVIGTRVTQVSRFQATGISQVLARILGLALKKRLAADLQRAKTLMEARAAVPA
jgi:uncharacterized protein YndB with AHSA1/START domain